MANHSANQLADYLRQFCRDAVPPDDATLWERFARSNEKEAFEVLVHRHGSMVLACAYRVLADRSQAEDVFQATFLNLARSRNRIREPNALASWLYKTAYRLAVKSRNRRRPVQTLPDEAVSSDVLDEEIAWREVKRMLDEELHRLPERLRSPLLLCYLCGLTRDEAARQLGCSFDSLKRRLEEGRNLLRARLERRGITGAGLALAVFAPQALQAIVPLPLVESCLTLVFTPGVSVPASVAALTLTTSTVTKGFVMKSVLATLFCVGLGVWGYTEVANTQEPRSKKNSSKEEPPPSGELAKEKESAPEAELPRADWEQRQRSFENLKKIMNAILNHEAALTYFPTDLFDKDGKPLLSWRVAILPYLGKEGEALYKQFKLDQPWDSEHNFKLLAKMPKVYRVGIEGENSTHTYYQVFAGPDTPFYFQPGAAVGGLSGEGGGAMGGAGGPGAVPGGLGGGIGGPPGLGSGPGSGLPGGPPLGPGSGAPSPGGGRGGPGGAPPIGGGGETGGPSSGLVPGGEGGFGGPAGPGGFAAPAGGGRPRITNVVDGTSNTIGVVEAGPPVAWTKPADIPFHRSKPLTKLVGPFSNALHVAMCDGSAFALKRWIDDVTMRNLISINDGVPIQFAKLHAALPPETAEERAKLKKKLDENRQLLAKVTALQKENAALVERLNRAAADFDEAEAITEYLNQAIRNEEAQKNEWRKEAATKEGRTAAKEPRKK